MSLADERDDCGAVDDLHLYALQALPPAETARMQRHLAECDRCRHELRALGPVLDALVAWPTDVLRPPRALWGDLAARIGADGALTEAAADRWDEPEWEERAPGIFCKLLSTDHERHVVSMLVRLAPGIAYPPHRHAGVEELHLLDGELWIEDRKLYPGDYSRAEPGTSDQRVWSETGCTCVLVTSYRDELR